MNPSDDRYAHAIRNRLIFSEKSHKIDSLAKDVNELRQKLLTANKKVMYVCSFQKLFNIEKNVTHARVLASRLERLMNSRINWKQ